MRYLLPLYFKEIKGEQDSIIGYMAIIVVFMLIMLVLAIWRPESWIIGMIQLPIGLLPVWFVYASLEIISREWREKSIALLSGIPVKPLYLLGAKMAALGTEYIIIALLLTGGLMLIGLTGPGVVLEVSTIDWLKSVTIQLLLLLPITPIIFLIYLSGVSISRWFIPVRIFSVAALSGLFIILEKTLTLFFMLGTIKYPWLGFSSYAGYEQYVFSVVVIDIFLPLSFLVSLYIVGVLSFLAGSRRLGKSVLP